GLSPRAGAVGELLVAHCATQLRRGAALHADLRCQPRADPRPRPDLSRADFRRSAAGKRRRPPAGLIAFKLLKTSCPRLTRASGLRANLGCPGHGLTAGPGMTIEMVAGALIAFGAQWTGWSSARSAMTIWPLAARSLARATIAICASSTSFMRTAPIACISSLRSL